jgi:hypothetical protein
MKTRIAVGLLLVLLVSSVFPQDKRSALPAAGVIPDEATAIKVAEAVLVPIFGEDHLNRERPLHGRLDNGIWTVYGTLPKRTIGGTMLVRMKRKDGQIIEILHSL